MLPQIRWFVFWAVLAVSAASSFMACGSDAPENEHAVPEAGVPVDANASPRSDLEACKAWVKAVCERKAECRGEPAAKDCLSYMLMCPDFLFAKGSGTNIDEVFACAEQRRAQDCNDALSDIVRACVTAGTLAAGRRVVSTLNAPV